MSQQDNLIALLRASLQEDFRPALQDACYEELLLLAGQQALTALLYPAVKKQPLPSQLLKLYKEAAYSAAAREALQNRELTQFFSHCEEAEIPVLPLKGCVIKDLYPQPALREMSDVDLLIPPKKRRAMAKLMAQMGNRSEPTDCDGTDVYQSPLGLRYEIHLCVKEDGFNPASAEFCCDLWKWAKPRTNSRFVYELSPEAHYTYILCHFVKHLLFGGVGLRQLTDLYLWQKHHPVEGTLLQALGLDKLQETIQCLTLHYFEGQPATETAMELGDYLFSSGVYGTEAQRQTDLMLRNGQGFAYYLHRCFPPYSAMVKYFPALRYVPVLLPFFWLWRILRAVIFRRSKMKTEIQLLETQTNETLEARVAFYRRCGLSVYEEKDF